MKIALIAPFEETVPPIKYGGTELVVANLAEGLVNLGHDVHVYAAGNSNGAGTYHKVFESTVREMAPRTEDGKMREAYKFVGIGKVLEMVSKEKFDVVHNHIGWRLLPFNWVMGAPMVTTLHGPFNGGYTDTMHTLYGNLPHVSISNSQRLPLPALNYVGTVYNGIAVNRFDFNAEPEDYVAFLGRMSPEKGPLNAIGAAKAAGVRLKMAAKVDAVDKDYFEREIEPLIDGDQIQFLGEVDHAGKNELLRNAKALMALIQWEEPFGLFMVEALACGTPVICNRRGSVPELITEETGRIFNDATNEQAAAAIKSISSLSRKTCRERAEKYFSLEAMAQGYANVYAALL